MTTLRDLFPGAGLPEHVGTLPASGITADSRTVAPGYVFVAVPGTKVDGLGFVAQAVENGAVAIVAERRPEQLGSAAFIETPDPRDALAHAAARFYPAQPATIVAVTGTSGKTSVAAFVRQIWLALGHQAASLGTIGLVTPSGSVYGSLTTPDPVSLHRTLDRLAREGVTHLAMEASSHGLDQHRLDAIRLAAGAFTNLSRDHLDYHPSVEAYLAAKLRLFDTLLESGKAAVVAADSAEASTVAAVAAEHGLRILTVGETGEGIRLLSADREGFAMRLRLQYGAHDYEVPLPLLGDFQVSNALVAAGLCIATGSDPAAVMAALATLEGAPGRLELVGAKGNAPIFVDYAHKPDALAKTLGALRPLTAGRLVVVFGCGGDRDPGKRPIMGDIAVRTADVVIVTDDNPRTEDPAKIRAAILARAPGAVEVGNRAAAIERAVSMLRDGDVLVIAGKGHETGQIVGEEVLAFSDHDAVRAALRELCA